MFVVLAGLGGLTPPTKMRVVVGLAGILGGVNPPQHSPRHITGCVSVKWVCTVKWV